MFHQHNKFFWEFQVNESIAQLAVVLSVQPLAQLTLDIRLKIRLLVMHHDSRSRKEHLLFFAPQLNGHVFLTNGHVTNITSWMIGRDYPSQLKSRRPTCFMVFSWSPNRAGLYAMSRDGSMLEKGWLGHFIARDPTRSLNTCSYPQSVVEVAVNSFKLIFPLIQWR